MPASSHPVFSGASDGAGGVGMIGSGGSNGGGGISTGVGLGQYAHVPMGHHPQPPYDSMIHLQSQSQSHQRISEESEYDGHFNGDDMSGGPYGPGGADAHYAMKLDHSWNADQEVRRILTEAFEGSAPSGPNELEITPSGELVSEPPSVCDSPALWPPPGSAASGMGMGMGMGGAQGGYLSQQQHQLSHHQQQQQQHAIGFASAAAARRSKLRKPPPLSR
eukprot:Opistho-2@84490